jgi:hypothetical protein
LFPKVRICVPTTLLAAALAFPAGAEAKRCNPPDDPNALGPTYVTAQTVKGVSCKDGRGLIQNWDDCRRDNGGRDGKCKRPGFRFRCRESRFNKSRTSYDGKVRCKRGGDRVKFTYTQFI